MFSFKKFSFLMISYYFSHILQTKLSHPVQIPDILNAWNLFPISWQPWTITDSQQQQLAKTATKINRVPAMTKTKHGCQEIGKRFQALSISRIYTGWINLVCRIWEKYWINFCKAHFFIIKHLNVQMWIIKKIQNLQLLCIA